MTNTETARTAGGASARAGGMANRPAKVSAFFALSAVAFLGSFATGIAWINPGLFVGLATLCALIAIPAGHVGRFRARRSDGSGRGLALAGILTGWLLLIICALATLAFFGLVAGLAVLIDHA
jgi:hypothetical protein